MKIVIDIPEYDYRQIKEYYEKNDDVEATYSYIYHGTPLPKNHGRLIDADELLKAIDTWDKFGVDDTGHLFRLDNLSLPHYVPYTHYDDMVKSISGAETIIEAESGEE